ncbi:hypothetical protein [Dethiothermospora halolimnae]|uniref:hypothetical protein n=1 Tax=Dethiothermospora halolimnae TaxID=3114390 RepID=UPI003CCC18CD
MTKNINFDKYEKEILELSFISRYKRDTDFIRNRITEIKTIRDDYLNRFGLDENFLRLQEIIINYNISLKEALGLDYKNELKSLNFLLSINYNNINKLDIES